MRTIAHSQASIAVALICLITINGFLSAHRQHRTCYYISGRQTLFSDLMGHHPLESIFLISIQLPHSWNLCLHLVPFDRYHSWTLRLVWTLWLDIILGLYFLVSFSGSLASLNLSQQPTYSPEYQFLDFCLCSGGIEPYLYYPASVYTLPPSFHPFFLVYLNPIHLP